MPCRSVRHCAHAGAHDVAIGQNDFHTADFGGVLAIGGVADPAIESVAHDAAPARRRRRHPQFDTALLDIFVKLEEADARLDHGIAQRFVDLDDSVHAFEVENDGALEPRCRAAIAMVLAAGDRPERDPVLARHGENVLDLLDGGWRNRRGSGVIHRIARSEGIEISLEIFLRAENPLLADDIGKGVEGFIEAPLGHVRRQNRHR